MRVIRNTEPVIIYILFTVIKNSKQFSEYEEILKNSTFDYETNSGNTFYFECDNKDEAEGLEAELTDLFIEHDIHLDFEIEEL